MSYRIIALFAVSLLFAGTAIAEEVTWRQHIKPVFDARCAGCHGADSPEYRGFKEQKEAFVAKGIGPRMDTYSHLIFYTGWPDTGALMRRLDDAKPGNMYQHLGDDDAERQQNLGLFKAWVGNWNLGKWKDVSKEEIDAIKVAY